MSDKVTKMSGRAIHCRRNGTHRMYMYFLADFPFRIHGLKEMNDGTHNTEYISLFYQVRVRSDISL